MDVSVRDSGNVTILDIRGKILGGPESDPLRDAIDEVLDAGRARLLVNLTGVPWMNSAGLGILLAAYTRLREKGGEIRLYGVGDRVQGILRTTKLLTVLAVLADEEAGVRSFRPGPEPV